MRKRLVREMDALARAVIERVSGLRFSDPGLALFDPSRKFGGTALQDYAVIAFDRELPAKACRPDNIRAGSEGGGREKWQVASGRP
jgi:hypothetical protein